MVSVFTIGYDCYNQIKHASWFPYKTGNLKFNATQGYILNPNLFLIHFDSTIAPYVQYLEEGTSPHNIPRAFGNPLPFGTKGRFNGKFHPESTKHKGFISDKCINTIINTIMTRYKGVAYDIID